MTHKRFKIVDIIPPRPGARVGTIVFDPEDHPPVESMTVPVSWLRSTHARVGGRVSFLGRWLRYHWEELPKDLQRVGIMDELRPRKAAQ